jgi:hypothetical protein
VGQHKEETQLHNQEISGFPRQVDLFIQAEASRGSKSGAGMGVFSSGEGEEYTTVTQVWGRPGFLAQEININKELTRCIQMVIIKVH